MNVYVVELSKRLASLGIEVEIFTRATSSALPPTVELVPGVVVRNITAGPFDGLSKADLPAQLCAFAAGVLRAEARQEPGHYDLVHSHYWLSGQVGWIARERWGVPLVHSMHTMARVKNALLAEGDTPEPAARVIGEAQVVDAADRLVANTDEEAKQLVDLYGADPDKVATVAPGVDLSIFQPGPAEEAKARLGIPEDAIVLLFVGRIQPLKAPDVLLRTARDLLDTNPELRSRLVVAVVGGPSGTGLEEPNHLQRLARDLGIADVLRIEPAGPQDHLADWYRAAVATVVPSYNESFGLVAIESGACGTPVVAASVGGLRTAVRDGVSGVLIDGHDPGDYARALRAILTEPSYRSRLASGALSHAAMFGWSDTVTNMLAVYSDAVEQASAELPLAVNQ